MAQTPTFCSDVWVHPQTNWGFELRDDGTMWLNGRQVDHMPDWVSGPPQWSFGQFTPWAGGDCPIDPDTVVRAHFRGRLPYVGPAIYRGIPKAAQGAMWHHAPAPMRPDPATDIIGYQVLNG